MAAAAGAAAPPLRSFADVLSEKTDVSPLKPPGKFKGMPAVAFTDQDIHHFAQEFKFALIGKFAKGRPSMADLRKAFDLIGFGGAFSIGLIDNRHVLINFDLEEDFQRCWLRKSWSIQGFFLHIFKWSPDFRPDVESPIVPVWIALEGLPPHLHVKRAIYSIANLIGTPLKVDNSTLLRNRPSTARVCVELNVSIPPPEQVWITNGSYGDFAQLVIYEHIPQYCKTCRKFGHLQSVCRSGHNDKPTPTPHHGQIQSQDTHSPPQQSTPTIVPPRKRWRPIMKQPVDQQGSSSEFTFPTMDYDDYSQFLIGEDPYVPGYAPDSPAPPCFGRTRFV
ncbi:uncharacterized protein LOC116023377 [Ipomoea triloba]|uniref:uncharacterized protein LOC116023377 n=1 Tax=Ipomoea triloba TaxID=35885 RepID=UPI00125D8116|nr:uncharacterized protein LOC116023377 [Ipomoea triloba]